MNEKTTRRRFTREFKVEAVELLFTSDKTAVEIAGDLGIRSELLYRWKSEYVNDTFHSFPGSGHLQDPEEEQIRKLERELRSVKEERDILKSTGLFLKKRICISPDLSYPIGGENQSL